MELSSRNIGEASDYYTTDPTKCVKILNLGNNNSVNYTTIPEFFSKTVDRYPQRSALMYRKNIDSKWIPVSYAEYKNRVDHFAKVFMKLGLEYKGCVAVLAFNSPEWFISELAAIHAGGKIVGIYNTNSPEACKYVLEKSQANIIVVDEDEQLEKIIKIKNDLMHLKAIIQTLPSKINHEGVYKWIDLENMNVDDFDDEYQKNLKEIKANSCCEYSFTSGTTGNPKGAMISHDNIMSIMNTLFTIYKFDHKHPEVIISYLPLSHRVGSLLDIFFNIAVGGTVYFADKNALKGTLLKTLKDCHPTLFVAVPRVYEKIYESITRAMENRKKIPKFIATLAQNSALKHHLNCINKKSSLPISYSISKKLVLNKIKLALGLDKIRTMLTIAAPFNQDIFKFFLSLDMPIYELFGMTESGLTFLSNREAVKIGSVGKCAPGSEGKISNPDPNGVGEICTRGRNSFMGYIGDLEKTREIFDDDLWIRSGDLGFIDNDGFLFLTGRIKELIITAGGENIPFLNIENAVKSECSAISNAFLVGDKKKYLTILITLKTLMDANGAPLDELANETIEHLSDLGLKYQYLSEVLNSGPDQKISNLIKEAINRANQKAASNAQKVQKFLILPNDFSLQTGELGPTMKLKRAFVLEKYKKEIDQLYNTN